MTCLQGNAALRVALAALSQGQWDKAVEQLAYAFTLYTDLARRLDTYYGLLMADLPRGRKVHSELPDLEQSSTRAARLLAEAFTRLPGSFSRQMRTGLAGLLVASGQVAYARRELAQSRQYFLRAIMMDPRVALTGQSVAFLLKSLSSPEVLDRLSQIKRAKIPG